MTREEWLVRAKAADKSDDRVLRVTPEEYRELFTNCRDSDVFMIGDQVTFLGLPVQEIESA